MYGVLSAHCWTPGNWWCCKLTLQYLHPTRHERLVTREYTDFIKQMTDVDTSPGDPVFYLHDNYVDRLYWQSQQINATDRMYAISGNTTVTEPASGWQALTLDYELNMFGAAENAKMEDVMNIQGGFLCYAFEY